MSEIKKAEKPSACAITALESYLKILKTRGKSNIQKIIHENCYLTHDKESTIINVAKLMASIRLEITKPVCLNVISAVLKIRVEQKDFVYPSMTVLKRLLEKYVDLVNLLKYLRVFTFTFFESSNLYLFH